MDFIRQHNIFNPEKQKSNIIIVGAGSTGSFITLNLAKLGFNDITVIDYDKIEEHNIPNQFYRLQDVGKPKVEALKEIVKDFTGTELKTFSVKIAENKDDNNNTSENITTLLDMNTIVIFCLDNIDTRKLIYNQIKELPVKLIDTRMGGEGYQIYTLDMTEKNKEYEETLEKDTKEAPCGEKSVIYTILSLASETCNIVKQIDKGEDNFKQIKREMKTLKILGK